MDNPERNTSANGADDTHDARDLTNEIEEALAVSRSMACEIHRETQIAMIRVVAKWAPALKGTTTGSVSHMIGIGEGLAMLLYSAAINIFFSLKASSPYSDEDKAHQYAHDAVDGFLRGFSSCFEELQDNRPVCEFDLDKNGVVVDYNDPEASISKFLKESAERTASHLN